MSFKINITDKTLNICSGDELEQRDSNSVIVFIKNDEALMEAFEYFKSHPSAIDMTLCTDTPEQAYNHIIQRYELINAAGGLIINEAEQFLLIRRNERWDLPKGKQEPEEPIESTAIREVCEECGIRQEMIKIEKFLCRTAHIYNVYGPENLKHTYWYLMRTLSDVELTPQSDEGIQQIIWVKKEDMLLYLEETYPSIREVFQAFNEGL